MTIAQTLEKIIAYRPGVTRRELAEALFGDPQVGRINKDCAWLADTGRVRLTTEHGLLRHWIEPS